jgi:4'-phosphopantetheinyl transferase EntD
VIERLVPDAVAVASTREELLEVELFPEEERLVRSAVDKRRHDFTTGRACARRALERLGIGAVAIPSGERGMPLWPPGVVGSITHCRGYRAAAVARAGELASVGIDAEVHEPLPDGVLRHVAFGPEIDRVAAPRDGVCLDKLLFSAKEAIYKAWFPLAGRWLGFEDVDLTIDVEGRSFHGRLLVPGPARDGVELTGFAGRWAVEDGIVAAAVVVPHEGSIRIERGG